MGLRWCLGIVEIPPDGVVFLPGVALELAEVVGGLSAVAEVDGDDFVVDVGEVGAGRGDLVEQGFGLREFFWVGEGGEVGELGGADGAAGQGVGVVGDVGHGGEGGEHGLDFLLSFLEIACGDEGAGFGGLGFEGLGELLSFGERWSDVGGGGGLRYLGEPFECVAVVGILLPPCG